VRSESRLAVLYSCPHCRAQIEAQVGGWDGWMRCPACGKASLPPEPDVVRAVHQSVMVQDATGGLPAPAGSADPDFAAEGPQPPVVFRRAHTTPTRLIFTTGLVLSLVLALVSFLDMKPRTTAIFGFLAIVCFLMLLRSPTRRAAPWAKWRRPGTDAAKPTRDHG
jgi:hypothetical protein